ncbi:hypothetical protein [Lactococcus lactis]|uniref:hypothetical protein n=1 Tax=Lactococcus lactis TaxID=1358 RepID=UPI0011AB7908|nr:hypothetical protein [Lactococcus lactis]
MESYKDIAEKMFSYNLVVYAEDPEFYKFYFKPNVIIDPVGLSCDRVREHVTKSGNINVIGIVDGDFNDSIEHSNLFKIDYYSIENMLLCNHTKLETFKQDIISYVREKSIKKNRLSISFDNNNYFLHKENTKIQKKFLDYINTKIVTPEQYIKYMDLKNIVQAHQKKFKKIYISTLHTQVKINEIFSESETSRLKSKIDDVENVDLIYGSIDYGGYEV